MSTATQTPPEKCPICGVAEEGRDTDEGRVASVFYMCGAMWVSYSHGSTEWLVDCPRAMTAALRVGATLHATPLELARQALVDAAVASLTAEHITSLDIHKLRGLALAYRALLEPKP